MSASYWLTSTVTCPTRAIEPFGGVDDDPQAASSATANRGRRRRIDGKSAYTRTREAAATPAAIAARTRKETRSDVACATRPTSGGPTSRPRYPIVVTVATALAA